MFKIPIFLLSSIIFTFLSDKIKDSHNFVWLTFFLTKWHCLIALPFSFYYSLFWVFVNSSIFFFLAVSIDRNPFSFDPFINAVFISLAATVCFSVYNWTDAFHFTPLWTSHPDFLSRFDYDDENGHFLWCSHTIVFICRMISSPAVLNCHLPTALF